MSRSVSGRSEATHREQIGRSKSANAGLLISVSLVSLIFLELGLRIFTVFPVTVDSNKEPHDELNYVVASSLPDVDAHGFRNPTIPKNPSLVAIGDSFTYGYNVNSNDAWPYQLAALLGSTVYNLGVGSYGIYQYYRLFEMALELEPDNIVIGLYPANDLVLGACSILMLEYWQLRLEELGLSDGNCERQTAEFNFRSAATRTVNSFAIASALDDLIWDPLQANFEIGERFFSFPAGTSAIAVGSNLALEHLASTDLSDNTVAKHFVNSKILFARMKKLAEEADIRLAVMVIPSMERVLARWADQKNLEVPTALRNIVNSEEILVNRFLEFFDFQMIRAADATPSMVDLLARNIEGGIQTFRKRDDHPFEAGYATYANVARGLIGDPAD